MPFARTISQKSSFIITPGTWLLLFVGVLTTIGCYQTTLSLTQANFRQQQTYQSFYRTWPPQKNAILVTFAIRTDIWLIGGPTMLLHFATSVENYITSQLTGRRTAIMCRFGKKTCADYQVIWTLRVNLRITWCPCWYCKYMHFVLHSAFLRGALSAGG
mgnify:CR=1 FL=1